MVVCTLAAPCVLTTANFTKTRQGKPFVPDDSNSQGNGGAISIINQGLYTSFDHSLNTTMPP